MRATIGRTLLLVTTAASAQDAAVPSAWFQVTWEERPMGGTYRITEASFDVVSHGN